MTGKPLSNSFFERSALLVARDLLGKYIVRRRDGRKPVALMITEVEAYDGPLDRASHAFRGRTPRTTVMFGPAGVFYVYFTYGMHWMVNVVTGPEGYPAAILLRAGAYRNPKTGALVHVTGPARLAKFLGVTGGQNRLAAARKNGLWFEDRGIRVPRTKIITGKRIGVEYAGKVWAAKEYNVMFDIK
ncbi:MAG TPA: DNA-3-methyladenine glycosylase [Candidatus Paceibacterota bacterium]|nr:DNA-3-methyladenine glycosylase [Candidatus Paceibacterota bacterium]